MPTQCRRKMDALPTQMATQMELHPASPLRKWALQTMQTVPTQIFCPAAPQEKMERTDMTADVALSAAKAAGVEITVCGGQLALEATNPPSPELLELLKQHKADIIAPLRKDQATEFDPAAFYENWIAIAKANGPSSAPEAQDRAFKSTVAEWLNRNFQPSSPGRCAHCHVDEFDGEILLAVGTENFGHVWLHDECFPYWQATERGKAISALQCMGIESPVSRLSDASTSAPS
jgi:hypothetical protein